MIGAGRLRTRGRRARGIDYGTACGWVDAIIAPADTRKVLALALEAVSHVGELPPLKTGVFQV